MSASMWFDEPEPGEDAEWDAAVATISDPVDDCLATTADASLAVLQSVPIPFRGGASWVRRVLASIEAVLEAELVVWLPDSQGTLAMQRGSHRLQPFAMARSLRPWSDFVRQSTNDIFLCNHPETIAGASTLPLIRNLLVLGFRGKPDGGRLLLCNRDGGFSVRHARLIAPFLSLMVNQEMQPAMPAPDPRFGDGGRFRWARFHRWN